MAANGIPAGAQKAVLYLIAFLVGCAFIFPFFWMIISSFKYLKDVLAVPLRFFPPKWYWNSYYSAFHFPGYAFARYYLNSGIVLVAAVILCVVMSSIAGYGFAKYRFRGNSFLFILILSTMMIPFEAIILPLFILIRQLGLQNSYFGLILPESLTAFGVFMMRQFFYAVPNEYLEAARMDGGKEFYIFSRISFPMAKTAVLALVIFHGQWVWNLLIWPLMMVSTPDMRTLPQAISQFTGVYFSPYPEQLAVSVTACIPLLVVFIVLSKQFVAGVAATGLKM